MIVVYFFWKAEEADTMRVLALVFREKIALDVVDE
jgi:hypothetical protein